MPSPPWPPPSAPVQPAFLEKSEPPDPDTPVSYKERRSRRCFTDESAFSSGKHLDTPLSFKERRSRRCLTSESALSCGRHQVEEDAEILASVKLMNAEWLQQLPCPLPRLQEVPSNAFDIPRNGDIVVAVSHAWRNQAHPDPAGVKKEALLRCSEELNATHSLFFFFDFLSVPQRPFEVGQAPRSEEEAAAFRTALSCMHRMYFLADRVLHLPWEATACEGEGAERSVPAKALLAAGFVQTGALVQVSQPAEETQLFDEVMEVDGEAIRSVEQLERLLPSANVARVRRWPYGLVNEVPADERGWVFLERFITMVKCAMLDETSADAIVLSPSTAIRAEIKAGADRLRAAALQEPAALQKELAHFSRELKSKRFSPASVDKREMACKGSESQDRVTVFSLMEEFVGHLVEHWDSEALLQRGLAQRLTAMVTVAEAVFGEWDSFSPAHGLRLRNFGKSSLWPAALLPVVPVLYVQMPLLLPMPSPDKPWREQGMHWFLVLPVATFNQMLGYAVMVLKLTRVRQSARVCCLMALWAVVASLIFVPLNLGAAAALDDFPVPFAAPSAGMVGAHLAPALYFCTEPEQRANPIFRRRVLISIVGSVALVALCLVPLLLLLEALGHVSLGWQAVLILGFFLTRLSYEVLGKKLAKTLGGDAMPMFLTTAIGFYECVLCLAFTKTGHWLIALEQISFDALENLYYVWSIKHRVTNLSKEQLQYLLTSLVLREFLEVLIPLQFTVAYATYYLLQPKHFAPLCEDNVRSTLTYLAMDMVLELIISYLTWLWLTRDGHAPVSALRGLVRAEYSWFLAAAVAMHGGFFAMSHPNFGQDLSFGLPWLREGYHWTCGATWAAPE